MKEVIVKKDFIDISILKTINDDLLNNLKVFLEKGTHIGGKKYGHLNATIGHHAKTILKEIEKKGLLELIAKEYDLTLEEYFLTCACNINLPGSKKQHIHRDTNFDDSKVIINIPLITVNEKNGSIEVYPGTNKYPLSFLDFLWNKSKFPPERINTNLGDIFVRDSNLFHRGMENSGSEPRPMVALTLSKKNIASSDEISAAFGGGQIKFMNNWFENDNKGKLFEHIYMHFPVIRSIKRIVASILKDKNLST